MARTSIPTKVYLNNKGGVGKTTCASLDAEYSALILGQRVLLIDWDGQMNLTAQWIGTDVDGRKNIIPPKHPDIDEDDEEDMQLYEVRSSIIDIFAGKEVLPHATYIGPDDLDDVSSPRVDIVAGSREGMRSLQENIETKESGLSDGQTNIGIKSNVVGYSTRKLIARLAEFCSDPQLSEFYDQIIIDAGPSETPLFRAAIQASTHIVTPYKPEGFSIMGVTTLVNNIVSANSNRIGRSERIKFIGLLPCIVDRGRGGFHEANIEEVKESVSYHLPAPLVITNSKKISSRQLKEVKPDSVFRLRPSDPIRKECESVFKYINNEVFEHGG
jgi:chromosome partitioning protein